MSYDRREDDLFAFPDFGFPQNSSSLPSSTQPSAGQHWPGLEVIQARSLPRWNCASRRLLILAFFFLSSYLFSIYFDRFLFEISFSSGVSLASLLRPRSIPGGTLPLLMSTVQFFTGVWVQTSSLLHAL